VTRRIGTLSESELHASLKKHYARAGAETEVDVDGYIADIRYGHRLIEIQTGNFSGFKRKLAHLLRFYPVHVVYPVPELVWLVRVGRDGSVWRQRSPKAGRVIDIFDELVSIPELIMDPNLTFEVALTEEEHVTMFSHRRKRRRWKRGVEDRRLVAVRRSVTLASISDFQALLPKDLEEPFTTADLSKALPASQTLTREMVYVLRRIGAIEKVGHVGNAPLYARPSNPELGQMELEPEGHE
jgi:hypothetical protein